MADIGHSLTEDILSDLEERIKEEYAKAVADAEEKLAKWLQKFEKGKLEQKALLDAGKISQQEYKDWLYRHTMMGQQWKDLQKVLAEDFHHANEIALQISRGQMPDIYAVNANYATYQIEHDGKIDTSFTLYNHDTAEILMKNEHVQLMPRPSTKKAAEIAANKDMQWNMRKIQSAVLQGVLQGESPFEVAHRLEQVGQMNYNSAVRYARTMGTSAQNAGRYQAYERATDLGVKLTIEWQATLDGRTRHDHRMMHGQRRKVGEPFETPDGFSILWPADSSSDYTDAPQREIWNCRCTLLSWVEGFEGDTVKHSDKMGSMSFEEWQQENAPKQRPASAAQKPEFVSRFAPATSIKEAEAYISQICDPNGFGAIGVSYAGVDLDVANAVNKTLVDLYDEFNVPKFGGIAAPAGNTKLGKQISNATAGYSPVRNSFILNRNSLKTMKAAEKTFAKEREAITDLLTHPERYDLSKASKTLLKMIDASRESGRSTVPENIAEALSHEFGHALEKQIKKNPVFETIKTNMAEYGPKISGYASQDVSEYIAESFASWRKGETVADPLLIDAFKLLRR